MNNEYLRVSNDSAKNDKTVNKYSAGSKKSTVKKHASDERRAVDFIIEELNETGGGIVAEKTILAPRPKLMDSVFFAIILTLFGVLLAVASVFLNKMYLLELAVCVIGTSLPLIFMYFIFSLETREKYSFSSISLFLFVGVSDFVLCSLISETLLEPFFNSSIGITTVRSIIELTITMLSCLIVVKYRRPKSVMSIILIATVISGGYAMARGISDNFSELFISVNVGVTNETVGAIINVKDFIAKSATSLLEGIVKNSVYKPCLFMSLVIIITEIFQNDFLTKKDRVLNSIFITLFCIVTYVLSNIESPFIYLNVIYNGISIFITAMLLYNAVNSAIRAENYE
ncbi:MAG: hypothetical protein IKL82_05440 [Clostridia bacterium]|nr:hypothetical protein [Clostridia bacterium]